MISHDEAHRKIVAKAAEDPAFRAALVADPRAAVASLLGIEIPSAVSVTVVEDSPTHLHIVLPAENDQLSDADLEAVAGGAGVNWGIARDFFNTGPTAASGGRPMGWDEA
ncbi:NHLP leader peptide family RiPP precursor (plasmid) [Tistrella mobilis]|jgi:hypothetical protein|uniref:NHLP leader peptide family RiPP precursor n=1 Tax=Tistrella mobilis TaxID=171437 RepID=UPI0035589CFA